VALVQAGSAYSAPDIKDICGDLVGPGMAIAIYWFHAELGKTFVLLTVAINTLIYSVLFGFLLEFLLAILRRRKLQS
jgi:hypothetical protein